MKDAIPSSINDISGNWTVQTGTTTSVNDTTRTITLGPETDPTTINSIAGEWTIQTGSTTDVTILLVRSLLVLMILIRLMYSMRKVQV